MNVAELRHPFTADAVRGLRMGDRVRVSGALFTARCRVHKALLDGMACPVDLRDGAIYHCSPIMIRAGEGWQVRAAGPSASNLVAAYVAPFMERYQVRVLIGAGGLGEETRQACARFGGVYLQTVGGAASKLAGCIQRVNGVHFLHTFGAADAMWALEADGLEAVVAIDHRGRSLHRRVKSASRRALRAIVESAGR